LATAKDKATGFLKQTCKGNLCRNVGGLPELKYRAPKAWKLWTSEDYNMGIFNALSVALTHAYLND